MTYKAGVIGFGRVGRNHAEAFLESDEIDLATISDLDEALVAEMGERWGVPEANRYCDHATMLANEALDVVSVATPDRYHHEHVLDVVESSADPDVVWCEKPIATTVADADEMVAACEEAGVELVVNHSRRFSSLFETVHELLHDRTLLGDLRSVRLFAGAEFLNIGTHYVDLVLYLLDAKVRDVRGGCVEPVASEGTTRFEGGATLVMEDDVVAYVEPRPTAASRLTVEGTAGTLSLPLSIAQDAPHEVRYRRVDEDGWTSVSPPEPLEELWQTDISGRHSTHEPGMVPAQRLFENAAEHVADVLAGRAANPSPGARATHGLETLAGMVVSEYADTNVTLPLARPFREIPLQLDERGGT